MKGSALLGTGRSLLPLPGPLWQRRVTSTGDDPLAWMTRDHHRVRDYVVREMPRFGEAIPPSVIAADLRLSLRLATALLDDLEKRLTFLYRDPEGAVTWAYPVTVAPTPHRVVYSTGETGYAA